MLSKPIETLHVFNSTTPPYTRYISPPWIIRKKLRKTRSNFSKFERNQFWQTARALTNREAEGAETGSAQIEKSIACKQSRWPNCRANTGTHVSGKRIIKNAPNICSAIFPACVYARGPVGARSNGEIFDWRYLSRNRMIPRNVCEKCQPSRISFSWKSTTGRGTGGNMEPHFVFWRFSKNSCVKWLRFGINLTLVYFSHMCTKFKLKAIYLIRKL